MLRPLALAVLALSTPTLAQTTWSPDRTWVYVVGVLEWQDSETWSSFPKENRRDKALVGFFRASGVPEDRIVYLQDREATRPRIDETFAPFLARAGEGDLLVVYFCGHGWREDARTTYFAPYDAGDDMAATAWEVAGIFHSIEKEFRGSSAWLMADCCHSGALAITAERREKKGRSRISYGCLASSLAREASTGAWTFTDAVLCGLRGDGLVDGNGDGTIAFSELAAYVEADMSYFDSQRSSWATTGSFPDDFRVADATGHGGSRIGERVEVLSDGEWYKAKILEAADGSYKVHYAGWPDDDDEWVAEDRIRKHEPVAFAAGTEVEVEWKDEWYPARVLEEEDGVHLVRYDGYGEEWDEWVGGRRIRPRQ